MIRAIVLALVLAVPLPLSAAPFDFAGTYTLHGGCIIGPPCEADGPVTLISLGHPVTWRGVTLGPPIPLWPAVTFTTTFGPLPPVPDDCDGCTLIFGASAHFPGSRIGDVFHQPDARIRLIEEDGFWALDQPTSATPEPATLLLLGASAAVIGWRWRRGR